MAASTVDEQDFNFLLKFAKPLVLNLPDPSDRALAAAWVRKLRQTDSGEESLRTDYLKLLLFSLHRRKITGIFRENPEHLQTLENFGEHYKLVDVARDLILTEEMEHRDRLRLLVATGVGAGGDFPPYIVEYTSDVLEYAAAQEIPKFGVHAYYAFSKEPISKWSNLETGILPKEVLVETEALSLSKTLSTTSKSADVSLGAKKSPKPKPLSKPRSPDWGDVKQDIEDDRRPVTWGSNLIEVTEPPTRIEPEEDLLDNTVQKDIDIPEEILRDISRPLLDTTQVPSTIRSPRSPRRDQKVDILYTPKKQRGRLKPHRIPFAKSTPMEPEEDLSSQTRFAQISSPERRAIEQMKSLRSPMGREEGRSRATERSEPEITMQGETQESRAILREAKEIMAQAQKVKPKSPKLPTRDTIADGDPMSPSRMSPAKQASHHVTEMTLDSSLVEEDIEMMIFRTREQMAKDAAFSPAAAGVSATTPQAPTTPLRKNLYGREFPLFAEGLLEEEASADLSQFSPGIQRGPTSKLPQPAKYKTAQDVHRAAAAQMALLDAESPSPRRVRRTRSGAVDASMPFRRDTTLMSKRPKTTRVASPTVRSIWGSAPTGLPPKRSPQKRFEEYEEDPFSKIAQRYEDIFSDEQYEDLLVPGDVSHISDQGQGQEEEPEDLEERLRGHTMVPYAQKDFYEVSTLGGKQLRMPVKSKAGRSGLKPVYEIAERFQKLSQPSPSKPTLATRAEQAIASAQPLPEQQEVIDQVMGTIQEVQSAEDDLEMIAGGIDSQQMLDIGSPPRQFSEVGQIERMKTPTTRRAPSPRAPSTPRTVPQLDPQFDQSEFVSDRAGDDITALAQGADVEDLMNIEDVMFPHEAYKSPPRRMVPESPKKPQSPQEFDREDFMSQSAVPYTKTEQAVRSGRSYSKIREVVRGAGRAAPRMDPILELSPGVPQEMHQFAYDVSTARQRYPEEYGDLRRGELSRRYKPSQRRRTHLTEIVEEQSTPPRKGTVEDVVRRRPQLMQSVEEEMAGRSLSPVRRSPVSAGWRTPPGARVSPRVQRPASPLRMEPTDDVDLLEDIDPDFGDVTPPSRGLGFQQLEQEQQHGMSPQLRGQSPQSPSSRVQTITTKIDEEVFDAFPEELFGTMGSPERVPLTEEMVDLEASPAYDPQAEAARQYASLMAEEMPKPQRPLPRFMDPNEIDPEALVREVRRQPWVQYRPSIELQTVRVGRTRSKPRVVEQRWMGRKRRLPRITEMDSNVSDEIGAFAYDVQRAREIYPEEHAQLREGVLSTRYKPSKRRRRTRLTEIVEEQPTPPRKGTVEDIAQRRPELMEQVEEEVASAAEAGRMASPPLRPSPVGAGWRTPPSVRVSPRVQSPGMETRDDVDLLEDIGAPEFGDVTPPSSRSPRQRDTFSSPRKGGDIFSPQLLQESLGGGIMETEQPDESFPLDDSFERNELFARSAMGTSDRLMLSEEMPNLQDLEGSPRSPYDPQVAAARQYATLLAEEMPTIAMEVARRPYTRYKDPHHQEVYVGRTRGRPQIIQPNVFGRQRMQRIIEMSPTDSPGLGAFTYDVSRARQVYPEEYRALRQGETPRRYKPSQRRRTQLTEIVEEGPVHGTPPRSGTVEDVARRRPEIMREVEEEIVEEMFSPIRREQVVAEWQSPNLDQRPQAAGLLDRTQEQFVGEDDVLFEMEAPELVAVTPPRRYSPSPRRRDTFRGVTGFEDITSPQQQTRLQTMPTQEHSREESLLQDIQMQDIAEFGYFDEEEPEDLPFSTAEMGSRILEQQEIPDYVTSSPTVVSSPYNPEHEAARQYAALLAEDPGAIRRIADPDDIDPEEFSRLTRRMPLAPYKPEFQPVRVGRTRGRERPIESNLMGRKKLPRIMELSPTDSPRLGAFTYDVSRARQVYPEEHQALRQGETPSRYKPSTRRHTQLTEIVEEQPTPPRPGTYEDFVQKYSEILFDEEVSTTPPPPMLQATRAAPFDPGWTTPPRLRGSPRSPRSPTPGAGTQNVQQLQQQQMDDDAMDLNEINVPEYFTQLTPPRPPGPMSPGEREQYEEHMFSRVPAMDIGAMSPPSMTYSPVRQEYTARSPRSPGGIPVVSRGSPQYAEREIIKTPPRQPQSPGMFLDVPHEDQDLDDMLQDEYMAMMAKTPSPRKQSPAQPRKRKSPPREPPESPPMSESERLERELRRHRYTEEFRRGARNRKPMTVRAGRRKVQLGRRSPEMDALSEINETGYEDTQWRPSPSSRDDFERIVKHRGGADLNEFDDLDLVPNSPERDYNDYNDKSPGCGNVSCQSQSRK